MLFLKKIIIITKGEYQYVQSTGGYDQIFLSKNMSLCLQFHKLFSIFQFYFPRSKGEISYPLVRECNNNNDNVLMLVAKKMTGLQ